MRLLHIAPVSAEHWIVTLDDGDQPPISEHGTRGAAETSARSYAAAFGYPEIMVHHANGEITRMLLDVDP